MIIGKVHESGVVYLAAVVNLCLTFDVLCLSSA